MTNINGTTCMSCHYTANTFGTLEKCPKCGAVSNILNSIDIAGLEIFPCVDLKVKTPKYRGRRKYVREAKSVAEHSVDSRLVRRDRLIDRGNNRYREKVAVVDTGEVIRQADHKLSGHTGRGSDKPELKRK